MKKIAFVALIGLLAVAACKKDKNTTYKVKFSVSGTAVSQFKITQGVTDNFMAIPFTGTRDTTVYLQSVTTLKLDAKGDGPGMEGTIYVNDVPVVTGNDPDIDGDNKTQVKIEYVIPQ